MPNEENLEVIARTLTSHPSYHVYIDSLKALTITDLAKHIKSLPDMAISPAARDKLNQIKGMDLDKSFKAPVEVLGLGIFTKQEEILRERDLLWLFGSYLVLLDRTQSKSKLNQRLADKLRDQLNSSYLLLKELSDHESSIMNSHIRSLLLGEQMVDVSVERIPSVEEIERKLAQLQQQLSDERLEKLKSDAATSVSVAGSAMSYLGILEIWCQHPEIITNHVAESDLVVVVEWLNEQLFGTDKSGKDISYLRLLLDRLKSKLSTNSEKEREASPLVEEVAEKPEKEINPVRKYKRLRRRLCALAEKVEANLPSKLVRVDGQDSLLHLLKTHDYYLLLKKSEAITESNPDLQKALQWAKDRLKRKDTWFLDLANLRFVLTNYQDLSIFELFDLDPVETRQLSQEELMLRLKPVYKNLMRLVHPDKMKPLQEQYSLTDQPGALVAMLESDDAFMYIEAEYQKLADVKKRAKNPDLFEKRPIADNEREEVTEKLCQELERISTSDNYHAWVEALENIECNETLFMLDLSSVVIDSIGRKRVTLGDIKKVIAQYSSGGIKVVEVMSTLPRKYNIWFIFAESLLQLNIQSQDSLVFCFLRDFADQVNLADQSSVQQRTTSLLKISKGDGRYVTYHSYQFGGTVTLLKNGSIFKVDSYEKAMKQANANMTSFFSRFSR